MSTLDWSRDVAALAVDALVDHRLVKKPDFELAVVVAAEEINVRLCMNDYPPPPSPPSPLSEVQALRAMQLFLEGYYERTQSDDLGSLLGDIQLVAERATADPAAWEEWLNCVAQAKTWILNQDTTREAS